MSEMTPRERFHAAMNFQPFDRLPLVEWAGWWDKTIDRWHGEGLSTDLTDRYDICRHVGIEIYRQAWIWTHRPGWTWEHIKTLDEYEARKAYLYPPAATVVNHEEWQRWAREQERGESVLWFTVDGFFWFARKLLGVESHLMAFYEQPELIHSINTDLAKWIAEVIEEICSICTPDFMTIAEDMSYNHGPMVSKSVFDEFMRPYYDRIIPATKHHGIISIVDSDGDVTIPSYWFEEAGIDGILPLERQAGVDIARLRADHPNMRFIGHYDKMVMHQGEKAMRAEFERLLRTAAKGGFLISCDHQTPPGVSYQDYQLYCALFAEYAAEAGRLSQTLARSR